MSSATRSKVFKCFRQLHKTKFVVFKDDTYAIGVAGSKITEEFKKGMIETDPDKIEELIQIAEDSDMLLRKTVVQARKVNEDTYRLHFTKDTHMDDNYPYDPNAEFPDKRSRRKASGANKTCEEVIKELDPDFIP